MPIAGLKTHKPSGAVPYPLILLEGEEKSGKTWAAIQFSGSERIGSTYLIDLNEGTAEEYGAIPGADYEVVEHDGSYIQVLNAILAVKAEAQRVATAGQPPVLLIVDSGSAIWSGLKDWASDRAKEQKTNKAALAKDPNADVKVTSNLWNDAGARWRKIQTALLTFPGIAVVTARGKEVTVMDGAGQPTREKDWSVESHRELPFAATAWVRLRRDATPQVVGLRSVKSGIKPKVDRAERVTDPKAEGRLLEWLVFDIMGCDPKAAKVREVQNFHGGDLTDDERTDQAAAEAAETGQPAAAQGRPHLSDAKARTAAWWLAEIAKADEDRCRELWKLSGPEGDKVRDNDVEDEGGESLTIGERITARVEHLRKPPAAEKPAQAAQEPPAAPTPAPATPTAVQPVEGDVLPAAKPAAVADPEDMCRLTAQRKAVLATLRDLFGGDEARDAVIAQEFDLEPGQVSTKRLREFMTREQQKAAS